MTLQIWEKMVEFYRLAEKDHVWLKWLKSQNDLKPNLVAPFDRKKHGLHCISYLVLNVLSMRPLHPNRNGNYLFELVSYKFLANKFKIYKKILYGQLIEEK